MKQKKEIIITESFQNLAFLTAPLMMYHVKINVRIG